jgi:hypothetical protein
MSEQQHLSEYCAGMFDGDGSINTNVSEVDYNDHNHRILTECTITNRYVAGLFDAEGCVKPTVSKKTNSAVDHHIDPQSRITNSSDPLASKLSSFAEALDVPYSVYHHDGDENRDPTFQFDVRSIDGVRKFLSALKPHLVAKRPQAEIMLNEILPRLDAGEHSNKRGFLGVMYHVDRLNELKGGNRGKYNLQYFEDLWGMEYEPEK